MGTIYGYSRCSTNETMQDVNRQNRELIAAGADSKRIFTEYEHGTTEHKQQQELLLKAMQPGDTLIVTEVSRLTRSTRQLCSLIETVQEKKICLVILNSITIDCREGKLDPMAKAFVQMAGVFAELEREMISDRVKSGLENARAKGKQIGRPAFTADDVPAIFYRHYPAFKNGSLNKS